MDETKLAHAESAARVTSVDEPSTDDLVAQQATEDIDKLLGEANVERPADAQPEPAEARSASGGGADDETLRAAVEDPGPAGSAEVANSSPQPPVAHPMPPGHEPAAALPHVSKIEPAHGNPEAKQAPAIENGGHSPADPDQLHVVDSDDSLPPWLQPLEWLNVPFSHISQSTRQVLGFVAVVTLFNALATIVYVLRFRHHH